MRIRKIKLPTLKNEIWFCITPDQEKVKRWFSKIGVNISNWPKYGEAFTWTKEGCFPVVYLPGIKTTNHISNMAHELIHVCWHVLDEDGIRISPDNHEVLTYLVSYLIKELRG